MEQWHVYIAECADHSLYTGVAADVARRIKEHNESPRGARYTKSRRPVALRYAEPHPTKGAALTREAALKRLSRKEKLDLIKGQAGQGTPRAPRPR